MSDYVLYYGSAELTQQSTLNLLSVYYDLY